MTSQPSKPIYPPVYWLLTVVAMLGLHFMLPIRQVVQGRLRYLGVLLLAAAVVVVFWSAGLFHRAGTTIKPFEKPSTLVVQGLYRFSRNPIYLGMVCGLVGIAVLAGSVTPFLVIPAFAYLVDRRFIRAEETQLRQTFGAGYEAYCARVRRWL